MNKIIVHICIPSICVCLSKFMFTHQELNPLKHFNAVLMCFLASLWGFGIRSLISRQMLLSLLPPSDHHKHRVTEKKLYGVEGSSTFLECIPKSLQARVTWTFQKHPQNAREEVRILGGHWWERQPCSLGPYTLETR